ncbi:hypothetical protein FAGAP_10733 [Fusarium agapanthi]|uniref:Uncharacterized protein n=1 Tax=Fusarium agapanthi TaxID=1803897 RepID=A0A9P5B2C3_9HYPO|nr:hypothetical protein FAGAP_10733 [Fusarium agapanthi]
MLVLSSNDHIEPSFTLAPVYGQDHLGNGLVLAALAPITLRFKLNNWVASLARDLFSKPPETTPTLLILGLGNMTVLLYRGSEVPGSATGSDFIDYAQPSLRESGILNNKGTTRTTQPRNLATSGYGLFDLQPRNRFTV